jgi:penicillin-binding protein 2
MRRLRILHFFIIAGFLFLCLALIYYQIFQFNKYRQLSQANRIRILPQSAARGSILDRNGNVLAESALSYSLLIVPKGRNYPKEQISKLSSILSIPAVQLISRYNNNYINPFVPVLLYRDISRSSAVAIGQLKYDLPEVIIRVSPKRIYPLKNICSHILGYLSNIDAWRLSRLKQYGYKIQDLVGYSGAEEVYDFILRPHEGGMQIEVDNTGRLSRILGFRAPQKGKDIELTIDVRLQRIIHNNLVGHTGCVIILNPENGEVLALDSFPSFNPQMFQDNSSSLELKSLLKDPNAPLLNRAINGLYPPGSVFKIVVATAGLERKSIDRKSNFFCSGNMQIGNREFSCWEAHGEVDIIDAIAHSCNIFFYNLGLRLGPRVINEYALRFGLNQATGIDLSGESTGFLPFSIWHRIKRRHRWFAGDTANLSIGQGEILVTPIQIARIMAAIANGGKLIKPRLLKSINPTLARKGGVNPVPARRSGIRDETQIIDSYSGETPNLMINKDTLQIIRQGLIDAVNQPGGTAGILSDVGIPIAGKTGTAQVVSGMAHGWFVGYFPLDKPKFVICVFLEHSGSGYYSCQLAKKIIGQLLVEGLI